MNEHQTQSSSTDSLYAKEVIVGQTTSIDITRPRTDDRRVWDVVFGVYGFPAVLLAHKLKLFSLLAIRPRSLSQVCEPLGIKRRPAEAILTAAVALGFLELRNGQYSVTPLTEDYLLDQSPTYFGTYLDLIINNYSVCSLDQLEKAVQTDTAQAMREARKCLSLTQSKRILGVFLPARCTAPVWDPRWHGLRLLISSVAR